MSRSDMPGARFQTRLNRGTRRIFHWTVAWLLTTMAISFGPRFLWNGLSALTLVAVAINIAVGIGLIAVYKASIADYDELQRKITLEAMSITLGAVFVVGIPYQLIGDYKLVPFSVDISHLYFLIGLTFLASLYFANRRYR